MSLLNSSSAFSSSCAASVAVVVVLRAGAPSAPPARPCTASAADPRPAPAPRPGRPAWRSGSAPPPRRGPPRSRRSGPRRPAWRAGRRPGSGRSTSASSAVVVVGLERRQHLVGVVHEVQHVGRVLAGMGAVEPRQRLHGLDAGQPLVDVHAAQQRLVEAGLELVGDQQDLILVAS